MDTIKEPNDIECKEPAPLEKTVVPVIDFDEYNNCKVTLHFVGVGALLTIMGFIIFKVLN